jgi:hypothetical protein
MYDEVLQPLQVTTSDSKEVDPSQFVDLDADDDALPQQGVVNLCE